MQKEWRIAPEKRWLCSEEWPFILQFKVSVQTTAFRDEKDQMGLSTSVKMINFASKTRNCVSKTRICVYSK